MSKLLSITEIAQSAKKAAWVIQNATTANKDRALDAIHRELEQQRGVIEAANQRDIQLATAQVEQGNLSGTLLKRLDIVGKENEKYEALLQGVLDVKKLQDPVGQTTLATRLDDGLELYRVTCPVGVLVIIFEARPEVVVQISCLAIKSGNAVILKGGKEAFHSNEAIYQCIRQALSSLPEEVGIPVSAVQLVSTREDIASLLQLDAYVDLVIPRGSKQLVHYIQNNTRIPVLGHADGICSVYVDEFSDVQKSIPVIVDSKTNYPAACNSMETLLIHASVLKTHLKPIAEACIQLQVEMRCDATSFAHLQSLNSPLIVASTEEDYVTEFLELKMAVKTVSSLQDAIDHINQHGSHHTDCILTEDKQCAEQFMALVDSAGVYWNASTRFADGFRYGFGAEIGVSTNKTHARGPVGLSGLVIYKYKLYGHGQYVSQYGAQKRRFLHEKIL